MWKIAIVGAGYMAREHARAFASLDDVEIAGIVSRSSERAVALASDYGATIYDSIESLYRHTSADAVVVAVNELSSREVCLSVFQYPWLCLLEKPAGVDLPQAIELQEHARRLGARAYVALNRRSYAATRRAMEQVSQDPSTRLISVTDQQDMESARRSGQPELVVRNYMYANSIHLIDYFSIFSRGELAGVEILHPWNATRPDFVVAAVRYTSGDLGVYQAVWDGPGPWAVTVTNRSSRLELRPLEKAAVQRRGERKLEELPGDPLDAQFKPGLRYQAEQVIEMLSEKRGMLASLDQATNSMELCAEIYGLRRKDAR